MLLNKLFYAVVAECDRSAHIGAPPHGEKTSEPVPPPGRAARHKVGGHRPLVPLLPQGEIIHRKEILVECHIVVEILE